MARPEPRPTHTGSTAPSSYRRAFWSAVVLTIVFWLIPFGGMVIYPFTLLATWAHELGHGITALLCGGRFEYLELHGSGSGLAVTATSSGVARGLVAAGGLIFAPALGALIVALGPQARLARGILVGLAGLLVVTLAVWVRNPFGTVVCIGLAAALGLAAWGLSERRRFMLVQLLGIQLSLSALRSWHYLFSSEASIGGRILPSDTAAISKALGGPYWLWGLLIATINFALLYAAYRIARRQLATRASP